MGVSYQGEQHAGLTSTESNSALESQTGRWSPSTNSSPLGRGESQLRSKKQHPHLGLWWTGNAQQQVQNCAHDEQDPRGTCFEDRVSDFAVSDSAHPRKRVGGKFWVLMVKP